MWFKLVRSITDDADMLESGQYPSLPVQSAFILGKLISATEQLWYILWVFIWYFMVVISNHSGLLHKAMFMLKKHTCLFNCSHTEVCASLSTAKQLSKHKTNLSTNESGCASAWRHICKRRTSFETNEDRFIDMSKGMPCFQSCVLCVSFACKLQLISYICQILPASNFKSTFHPYIKFWL